MSQSETATEAFFQLIVIGSSAGGIEALSQLVTSLPVSFPVPIVIAQHLDPKRPSHLASILSRHSRLPVVIVEQHEKLEPGTIYVVPSNNHIAITDHDVRILNEGQGRPKPSVDLLFSSASQVFGEKLIAVILSGTGSDGTLGVRAVHDNGGTVLAQNPNSSAYPGMAQALAPETVDIVADLSQIGSLLFDLVNGKTVPLQLDNNSELGPFLEHLRAYNGMDFRSYKPGTILRRLQRRLVTTGTTNLEGYQVYLQAHPAEYEQLINSLLINVTDFMRDKELFTYLQEQILPRLIEHSRASNNELRVWSAGCATGQEVYSLAILLCEVLGDKLKDFNVKIFATDVDAKALTFARRGLYSSESLNKLPKELLARYFTLERDGYCIKKQVRDMLVFGEHDLSQRAPFPRIDLVLCRNVLIYFNQELQQHALKLFAFALREGGYLVLGRSENNHTLADLFAPAETEQRVYQRHGKGRFNQSLDLPLNIPATGSGRPPQRQPEVRNLFQMQWEAQQGLAAKDNLLLKLPVGVVVVDSRFDIHEINNLARRLLSIFTAAIGEDLVHLAQHLPARELGAAITRAIRENTVTTLDQVEVPDLTSGEPTFLKISCYPHPPEGSEGENSGNINYGLLLITDITTSIIAQREQEQATSHQVRQAVELAQSVAALKNANAELAQSNWELHQNNADLKEAKHQGEAASQHHAIQLAEAKRQGQEVIQRHAAQITLLVEANQSLLKANQELTELNADLRKTREQYLMYSEEAQAAIEEAETLNEEMQATNEELETLNEEYQATIEELNNSNLELALQTTDLQEQKRLIEQSKLQLSAILDSMSDALVVVGPEGKNILTNPAYRRVFEGASQPLLLDETGEKALPPEAWPLVRAARGETFNISFSFEAGSDGTQQWWEAIGQPVQLDNNATSRWGLVVMRDITERNLRQNLEQFVSLVIHELRTPLTAIKGFTQMVEGRLQIATPGADSERMLSYLGMVLSQTQRLEGLITDLGDVNRLQNGKFKFNFAPVRLDSLLEQTVEIAQQSTTTQTVELVHKNGSAPVIIKGDASRLQQVILNLINNARTHAASSPRIKLSLAVAGDGLAELKVQDYGPGIPARDLPKVFSRFYQASHGQIGLGLGLFICQQIVEAHGGTVGVESVEGEGTTFIVRLPIISSN